MKNYLKSIKLYGNSDYIDRVPSKKFKIKIDQKIDKEIEVPGNILKHAFGSKSLNQHVNVFYELETINV